MGTVLAVIFVIAAVILVFVALVLLVPFRADARGGYRGRWDGSARIRWLGGFIAAAYLFREKALQFSLAGMKVFTVRPGQKEKKEKAGPAKIKEPGKKKKRRFPFSVPVLLSMTRDTFRSLRPRGGVSAVFGTGDPAETGRIYGYLVSVLGAFPLPIDVSPDFSRAIFSAGGRLSVRVWVAQLSAIVIRGYFRSRKYRKQRSTYAKYQGTA